MKSDMKLEIIVVDSLGILQTEQIDWVRDIQEKRVWIYTRGTSFNNLLENVREKSIELIDLDTLEDENRRVDTIFKDLINKKQVGILEATLILDTQQNPDLEILSDMYTTVTTHYHNGIAVSDASQGPKPFSGNVIIPFPTSYFIMFSQKVINNLGDLFEPNKNDPTLAIAEFGLVCGSYGFSTIACESKSTSNLSSRKSIRRVVKSITKNHPYLEGLSIDSFKNGLTSFISPTAPVGISQKPSIVFCLSYLGSYRNGTSVYAVELLKSFVKLYSDKFNIAVVINPEEVKFFQLESLSIRFISPDNLNKVKEIFDLAFVPRQIFQIDDLIEIRKLARKYVITILDIIAIRCLYIGRESGKKDFLNLMEISLLISDKVITISKAAKTDILTYFNNIPNLESKIDVTPLAGKSHSHKTVKPDIKIPLSYIFVTGNQYKHKSLELAYNQCLKHSETNFVFLGLKRQKNRKNVANNITILESGTLSSPELEWIYKHAKAVIYPSLYEGYGLPVLEAVERGKKVIISNTPVNREIVNDQLKQYKDSIFLIESLAHLDDAIKFVNDGTDISEAKIIDTWERVAKDTKAIFDKTLLQQSSYETAFIRSTFLELIQKIQDVKEVESIPVKTLLETYRSDGIITRLTSIFKELTYRYRLARALKSVKYSLQYEFKDKLFRSSVDKCSIIGSRLEIEGWAMHLIQKNLKIFILTPDAKLLEMPAPLQRRQDVYEAYNKRKYALRTGFRGKFEIRKKYSKGKFLLCLQANRLIHVIPLNPTFNSEK